MRTLKVFFFGDSISVGQLVSVHQSWVARTSAELGELGRKRGCKFIVNNASGNGRTTRQALEVMPYEIQSQHADVLIVQFGMNDCNYWSTDRGVPRVSPKAFEANLEEIIARAFCSGVQKVLMNTNHPTGQYHEPMPFADISYQESNERYNRIIRKVVQQAGSKVILSDVEEAFKAHTAGNRQRLLKLVLPSPDLLHLSELGHDVYFRSVHPIVEAAVLDIIARKEE